MATGLRQPSSGLQIVHSIHTNQCPTYSSDMERAVAVNQMRSSLRSANTAQYIKLRCRTEIGKHAALVWNDLTPSLHSITDSKLLGYI